MTYQEAREYLDRAAKKGIVLGLQVMEELLKHLGNPEKKLNIVHIAGTNGKGSILAYLEQIFLCGGYSTGRYVSPVIGAYEERFLLSSVPVKMEEIPVLVSMVREAAARMEEETGLVPTVFEIETAMAFLCFERAGVDVVLLETGMGGRLDATNVIKNPLLCIFASISEDHMPILGENLEEIAGEKAGIIKEGCPVVMYPKQESSAEKVIQNTCMEKHSELHLVDENELTIIEETREGSRFLYKDVEYFVRLLGQHQIYNALTAIAAADYLGDRFEGLMRKDIIVEGIEKTRWRGRLEKLCDEPLTYLDGAHNKDAAKRLAQFIKEHLNDKNIIAVTGVLGDKDYKEMMRLVLPLVDQTIVFTPDNMRGLPGEELIQTAKLYCKDCICKKNVREALKEAYKIAAMEDVVIVFGSLSFITELGEDYVSLS